MGEDMSYSNPYLNDFEQIFFEILRIKEINPAKIEVVVLDEEIEERPRFECTDVKDVLYQLGPKLNAITIYTDRPNYFFEYVKSMDEENGLIVSVLPKRNLKGNYMRPMKGEISLILDFEWTGSCKNSLT